jgi:hypothetical protein
MAYLDEVTDHQLLKKGFYLMESLKQLYFERLAYEIPCGSKLE